MAGLLTLSADRHAPFVRPMVWNGANLMGATFLMHIRLKPDAPGAPLLSIGNAGPGVLGFNPSQTGLMPDGITTFTVVDLLIPKANMEALPPAARIGDDNELAYDLHLTIPGAATIVALKGSFIVLAGVVR